MVKLHRLAPADTVIVKIGRNVITAEVLEVRPDKVKVRNKATGKEFFTARVDELVCRARSVVEEAMEYVAERIAETVAPQVTAQVAAAPELAEVVAQIAAPTEPAAPAAEPAAKPEKKRSLVAAALEILKAEGKPMNTRELVKLATERGLWTPTACKTPEQSLYGAFFLEMKNAERPRVKKSAEKGKFELA